MDHQRSQSVFMNRLLFATCALLLLGALSAPAYAQNVTCVGVRTTVASGLSAPFGMAVNGAGDVFIADPNDFRVVEVPASGGTQTTVGSKTHRRRQSTTTVSAWRPRVTQVGSPRPLRVPGPAATWVQPTP